MSHTYSGDPSNSDLDYYRFLVGDTGELDDTDSTPVESFMLSDAEVTFVINRYQYENTILYHLYSSIANILSRDIKNSLGPAAEDPISKLNHYKALAKEYKSKVVSASGLSLPSYNSDKVFTKGMHDND